jgi:hypothetical protein
MDPDAVFELVEELGPSEFLTRFAAPFAELYEDVTSAIFDLLPADSRASAEWMAALHAQAILEKGSFGTTASLRKAKQSNRGADNNISQELVTLMTLFQRESLLVALPILATACCNPGTSLVALCGISIKSRIVNGMVGLFLAGFAASIVNRYHYCEESQADPSEEQGPISDHNRHMLYRAAFCLAATSCVHVTLAALGGAPPIFAEYFTDPDTAFLLVTDLVVSPLLLVNTGYLAGIPWRAGLGPMVCSGMCAAGCLAGISLAPQVVHLKYKMACYAFSMASVWVCQQGIDYFAHAAHHIGEANAMRVRLASDLLICTWSVPPAVLGVASYVGMQPGADLIIMGLCANNLLKAGTAHIQTRSRFAIESIRMLHSEEGRRHEQSHYVPTNQASRRPAVPEPQSEPGMS